MLSVFIETLIYNDGVGERAAGMKVHGVANPVGESDEYAGVYLRKDDIKRIVENGELIGKPVLLEHDAHSVVGRVDSAWSYRDRLDLIVDLPDDKFWSIAAGSMVAGDTIRDFSLGYKVNMTAARPLDGGNGSGGGKMVCVGRKEMVEVSLVRKGARPNCHILNFASG